MPDLMHPVRLVVYTEGKTYYPRELTEKDGKLYITDEDGTVRILNDYKITTIKDSDDNELGKISPTVEKEIVLPNASSNKRGIVKLSDSMPESKDEGSIGTSTDVSRADHAHPVADTGVDAGSYGPSEDTKSHTFTIPTVTVDAKGRVTSAANKTITVPFSDITEIVFDPSTTYVDGTEYPFEYRIATNEITAEHNPIVDLAIPSDYDTAQTHIEQYSKIYNVTTSDGFITVYTVEALDETIQLTLRLIL